MSGAQHGKTQYVSSVVMYEQCGVCRELFKKWHGNSKEKALEMLRSSKSNGVAEYGLLHFINREVA